MSNTRKLRTREFHGRPVAENLGTARPGETCAFHPDCCDPDDTACSGCGEPADGAIVFRGGQRLPFCAAHEPFVQDTLIAMAQRETEEAN